MVAYQKLYAYLVGQVDEALGLLEEGDLVKAGPVRELLSNALLRAEEAYIDAAEAPLHLVSVISVSGNSEQD